MLSSYTTTLLGRAPLPGKLLSRPAPPPPAATVSLPRQQHSSRAPRLRCRAYDIPHHALVELKRKHTPTKMDEANKWKIVEDQYHITLKFNVEDSNMKPEALDVMTDEYQEMLVIKGKGEGEISKELDVHLQMPPGCAANHVTATLHKPPGWLEVTIEKPADKIKRIPISNNTPT
ncbi:hypothetical protein BS78_K095600 [Paspalum vaginatum]|uniref:SHSP domain-containing protein n=1 Tax=Paspalum vaginatum TaxID=158149 RepID=A0A9W7X8B8_9POAL|nr:hypothetical protein BS78_K095600 [Paspalum vaginatum]